MSGTSLDGIDVALIETDGQTHVNPRDFLTIPYTEADRAIIRAAYGKKDRKDPAIAAAEALSTDLHIAAVQALLAKTGKAAKDIDLIGYHGQTVYHAPGDGITLQLGDGARMAQMLGVDVVYDMRSHDVSVGGQGAPLAPLYHWARVKNAGLDTPAVILNIGGVSNVTWLGATDADIVAFDTGPGNALMDDWMQKRTGARYDADGALAASGQAACALVKRWMQQPYFDKAPPKSLDRDEWDIALLGPLSVQANNLSNADGAATLMSFTVQGIARAVDFMPQAPKAWYVAGGGRHNKALMKALAQTLPGTVQSVDVLGWDGDATEAECFAYLGVRSKLGLPLSLPTTTGVKEPTTGGRYAKAV